jgi:hypothetical protein
MFTVSSAFSKVSFLFFFSGPGCDQQQFSPPYSGNSMRCRGEAKSMIFLTSATTPSKNIVDDPVRIVLPVWRKPNMLTSGDRREWIFNLNYK